MGIEELLQSRAIAIDRTIEKYLPRKYTSKSMEFAFGRPGYAYDIHAANKALAAPVWDMLDRGGKRWRPVLFLLACEALGGNPKRFLDFVVVIELVHEGSLVVDDLEDSSELRRGKPCTYRIFGTDIAVNAGNFMYYAPLLVLLKSKIPAEKKLKAYEIYSQELINIHLGQAMDIAWHRGIAEPNIQQYLQMCALKTGTLARMAARLGAVMAGTGPKQEQALGKLAESLGIAFQIQDDVLNLTATSGKGQFSKDYIGEDIREGKRTLMVIHALGKASVREKKRLLEILNTHTSDKALISEAISIMKKHGSVEYAKNTAKDIVRNAWKDADRMLKPSAAKNQLHELARFAIEREY